MDPSNIIPKILIELFNSIYPLEEEVLGEIASYLKCKSVKKKELLLKQGQICKNIYFIEKGLIRSFYNDGPNHITTWFMKENDIAISVKAFTDKRRV
ncbi:MAG: hypothetical protein V4539_06820 [Bacteroidota bacterium]